MSNLTLYACEHLVILSKKYTLPESPTLLYMHSVPVEMFKVGLSSLNYNLPFFMVGVIQVPRVLGTLFVVEVENLIMTS